MKEWSIKDQEEFIEWLKKHNMYNPMESSTGMCKMMSVWLKMREEIKNGEV